MSLKNQAWLHPELHLSLPLSDKLFGCGDAADIPRSKTPTPLVKQCLWEEKVSYSFGRRVPGRLLIGPPSRILEPIAAGLRWGEAGQRAEDSVVRGRGSLSQPQGDGLPQKRRVLQMEGEKGMLGGQNPSTRPRPPIFLAFLLLREEEIPSLICSLHFRSGVIPTVLNLAAIFKKPRGRCEMIFVTPLSSSQFCSKHRKSRAKRGLVQGQKRREHFLDPVVRG